MDEDIIVLKLDVRSAFNISPSKQSLMSMVHIPLSCYLSDLVLWHPFGGSALSLECSKVTL